MFENCFKLEVATAELATRRVFLFIDIWEFFYYTVHCENTRKLNRKSLHQKVIAVINHILENF